MHGIWIHPRITTVDPEQLRYLGVELVRVSFSWDQIERTPYEYDFTVFDVCLAPLMGMGLTILPCVTDVPFPGRYTIDPKFNCGTLSMEGAIAFQRFLKATFQHFPTIRHWQILNEADYVPDQGFGGGCLGANPPDYMPYLEAAYLAKVAVDPTLKIVFAALSADSCYIAQQPINNGLFNCNFFRPLLEAGAGELFDIAAFNQYHYYRRNHERPNLPGGMVSKVQRWRDMLAEFGLSKPIWITESGWEYSEVAADTELEKSEQASKVVAYNMVWSTALMTQRDRSPLEAVVHFNLQNDQAPLPIGWYGLYCSDGSPTVGAWVYSEMKKMLDEWWFMQDASEPTCETNGRWLYNTLQHWVFMHGSGLERHVYWVDSGRGNIVSTSATRMLKFKPERIVSVTDCIGAAYGHEGGSVLIGDWPIVVTLQPQGHTVFVPNASET